MPDDLCITLSHQRQTVYRRDGAPQGIDQVGHDKAVVTERPQVDVPHRLFVARTFFAKFHARRVGSPPGRSHPVFEPEGRGDRQPDASRQGKDSDAELAVELLSQPAKRFTGGLVGNLCVDLHGDRDLAVAEYPHRYPRVHIKSGTKHKSGASRAA